MFYVKFTLKDYNTKEEKIMESEQYNDIDMALNIVDKYIAKQRNYTDIKVLGNNKTKVQKIGGEILIEILEK